MNRFYSKCIIIIELLIFLYISLRVKTCRAVSSQARADRLSRLTVGFLQFLGFPDFLDLRFSVRFFFADRRRLELATLFTLNVFCSYFERTYKKVKREEFSAAELPTCNDEDGWIDARVHSK